MDRIFDREQCFLTLTDNGVGVDISEGMVLDGDFFKCQLDGSEQVTTRKGLRGESYTTNSSGDTSRKLMIKFLPSSPSTKILHLLRQSKRQFTLTFKNESVPAYINVAEECSFAKEPDTTVNGKTGFADYEFEVKANKVTQNWL